MTEHEDRFRELYAAHVEAITAYALRRVEPSHDAADVVADTFLVAWRRVGDLPAGDEARLWLYGVARKVVFNQRRGRQRRDRLGLRLRQELSGRFVPDPAESATARAVVRAALSRLGELDREVLTLALWEELEPREIAHVLGVSAPAVRQRLARARARLRDQLGHDLDPAGHVSGVRTLIDPEETR